MPDRSSRREWRVRASCSQPVEPRPDLLGVAGIRRQLQVALERRACLRLLAELLVDQADAAPRRREARVGRERRLERGERTGRIAARELLQAALVRGRGVEL